MTFSTSDPGFDRYLDFYLSKAARRYSDNAQAQDYGDGQGPGRRDREKTMLSVISQGDVDAAQETVRHLASTGALPVGKMSYNDLWQARYTIVSAITLYCRAALDGGLPESVAYRLSDSLIQTVDELESMAAVGPFLCAALLLYTNAVRRERFSGTHPVIRACHDYIIAHIGQPIRLEQLAQAGGRNPRYLSDLFCRELGVRPAAYVRRCKLEASLQDLELTGESVAAIADAYAFPSASAYCAYFKQRYGLTPFQYRLKLHQPGGQGKPRAAVSAKNTEKERF